MKKYVGIMLIIISSIVGILGINIAQEREYELLKVAFKQSEFEYGEGVIRLSGVTGKGRVSVGELKGQLIKIIDLYGMDGKWDIESIAKEDRVQVRGLIDMGSLTLEVNMANVRYNKDWTTYLYIEVMLEHEAIEVKGLVEKVKKSFRTYGVKPEVRMSIYGVKQMELVDGEIVELGERILGGLGAKNEQIYQNETSYSIYGYSRKISDYYIQPGTKNKMNINVVLHSNRDKDMTELYIATPLVDESY